MAEAECFRTINEEGGISHLAGWTDQEPPGFGVGAFGVRNFTPLIQFARLLKPTG